MKPRILTVIAIVLAAALSRLIPHPWNFAPITAIALFGGTHLPKQWAYSLPLVAMFLSDLVLGFHPEMPLVYLSFLLIVAIGQFVSQRKSFFRVTGAALVSSVLFFLLSNLGVWLVGAFYPKTVDGLVTCYIAAIPFFQNTLIGDLLYTATLFGGFALLSRSWSALRESATA